MATKILPKFINVTPLEMYKQITHGTYDNMRQTNKGLEYIPSQFGGIFGQQVILSQSIVMEITNFEVT